MKAIARFLLCLAGLAAFVRMCEVLPQERQRQHERAMKASETCGQGRHRILTRAQAFPLIPSYPAWVWVVIQAPEDSFRFDPALPMCRYDEETGCWVPMTYEQKPCSEVFPHGVPQ